MVDDFAFEYDIDIGDDELADFADGLILGLEDL